MVIKGLPGGPAVPRQPLRNQAQTLSRRQHSANQDPHPPLPARQPAIMQAAAKNLSSKPATTGSRAQHHMSIFDLNGDGKVDAEDFRIAAERAHLAGKEMSTFWYRAPIANLVYGLLDGDRPPSQENLKAVLNGYALVDALLLTIVMSMPMSMTFEVRGPRLSLRGSRRRRADGGGAPVTSSGRLDGVDNPRRRSSSRGCASTASCASSSRTRLIWIGATTTGRASRGATWS